jgi:hypothetical protein
MMRIERERERGQNSLTCMFSNSPAAGKLFKLHC